MNILEIIGAVSLSVIIVIALLWSAGYLTFGFSRNDPNR